MLSRNSSPVEEIEIGDTLDHEGNLNNDNAQGISTEISMARQIKQSIQIKSMTAGQYIAQYFPEVLKPISHAMKYMHDLALKTSKHISRGAEQENSTVMYALAAIPAVIGGIAYAGQFVSDQSYDKLARPLGDYVDNRLSHAKVDVAVSGMEVSGESSPENDGQWSEFNQAYDNAWSESNLEPNVPKYNDIPTTNVSNTNSTQQQGTSRGWFW